MSISPTTVIITGASRGVGLAIVRLLATDPPVEPLNIFACARKPAAVKPTPPIKPSSNVSLQWLPLDIADQSSIAELRSHMANHAPAGIDVLINVAGVNLDYDGPPGIAPSTTTLETNYTGTYDMCRAFLPLMRAHVDSTGSATSRIVNVSSVGSKLSSIPSPSLRKRIRHASSISEIDSLRDSYLTSVRSGSEEASGWPRGKAYSVSKAFVNAMTQVLAAENEHVLVNCCCPGWCDTDMGVLIGGKPSKTSEEGARIPIRLAFGDVRGVSGEYWENPSVSGKGEGAPSDWME